MSKYVIGKNLLFAGCFLLPTSGYIGPFLIFLACILGSSLQGFKALLSLKMYPLYFLSVLMLGSAFFSPFGLQSCGGIFNWLPFFWLFWSLSIYLKDQDNIKRIAMNLVYGTIPVLIIGFSHLIFQFDHSPRILGSFIVWHLLDADEFTGIFYNRNICAAWLAVSFPFFVALVRFNTYSVAAAYKKVVALFALLSMSVAIVMTNSRNGIGSLFFGTLGMFEDIFSGKFVIGRFRLPSLSVFLPVISALFLTYFLGFLHPIFHALGRFLANGDRLEIWRFGFQISLNNFFVGYGPGGFNSYVALLSPFDRSVHHVHSLPLDLWVSYGLIALIVFIVYVSCWLFLAFRSGIIKDSIFLRAWMVSFVLLIIFHVTDLPYLDARINLAGWILFAGIVSYVESSFLKPVEP